MTPTCTLRHALEDPEILGGALPGASWLAWRVLLIASMGEELLEDERALFTELTGREAEPGERVEELWAIVGRRGGKTRAAATLAVYLGTLCDHSDALAPGERGVLPILASSTGQATRAFNHVAGILKHSPTLASEIKEQTADTIRLKAPIDIEIRPANFRTIRGITAVGAIGDEVAFWHIEGSANPDREILDALRPALATTGGPLIIISSPYARRGELYGTYRRHYGPVGDRQVLVAKGPSRTFNPTLPQKVVDRAYERDAAVASAEFGGAFRSDVAAFVSREVIEAAIAVGVHERGPIEAVQYHGFVDPSGGSADAFTLAIAHAEGTRLILDAVRERLPPFSPKGVVAEFADLLKIYRISAVEGDRYAGEWPRESLAGHGISYRVADRTRSELYLATLPELNSGAVALLDEPKILTQFVGLERRTSRVGRDTIDHAPGQHDDVVNAIAGALLMAKPRADQEVYMGPPVVVADRGHWLDRLGPMTPRWSDASSGYEASAAADADKRKSGFSIRRA